MYIPSFHRQRILRSLLCFDFQLSHCLLAVVYWESTNIIQIEARFDNISKSEISLYTIVYQRICAKLNNAGKQIPIEAGWCQIRTFLSGGWHQPASVNTAPPPQKGGEVKLMKYESPLDDTPCDSGLIPSHCG